uniref:DNA-Directed RNA polymerase II, Subunit Rpb5 n=1 Tax=Florenciella sp. virus SA2 TaxID=3240092 RepID=A0AB39JET6_9VIRU
MSNENSTIINDIYNSRKQIIYYLDKLGYNTESYENFTISEINAMKQATEQNNMIDDSLLNFEVSKRDNESHNCKVVYYLKQNIKKNVLLDLVFDYYEYDEEKKKNNAIIIIILGNVNDTSISTIQDLWNKYNEYCALFDIATLQYNILEHKYVPKHEKLDEKDKIKMFQKYNVTNNTQLPEISMFDPVAKAILLKPDEICKITRIDKTSFENDYYRICVI